MIIDEIPDDHPLKAAMPSHRLLARCLERAQSLAPLEGEVSVLFTTDKAIRKLNQQYRGKAKPTDVLSFPALDATLGVAGDLVISVETAARQAAEYGLTMAEELKVLMLHGVLHLAGYDHEADTGEMAEREAELRRRMRLPIGLIARATGPAPRPAAIRKPTQPLLTGPRKKVSMAEAR